VGRERKRGKREGIKPREKQLLKTVSEMLQKTSGGP